MLAILFFTIVSFGRNQVMAKVGRPALMLWAWERPSDLSWLACQDTGVAYLAQTLTLSKDSVRFRPRQVPLAVPENCFLEAVTRIETDGRHPPTLTDKQIESLVDRIVLLSKSQGTKAVQVDFDAVKSSRPFYRKLIVLLKDRLPGDVELSITCLASWCVGDPWIKDLDVDLMVPMFFRMGLDHDRVLSHIKKGNSLHDNGTPVAIGLSLDEQDVLDAFKERLKGTDLKSRRVYLFSPKGFSQKQVEIISKEIR